MPYVDKGLATLIAQVKARHPGIIVGTIAGGGHVATWPATDHAAEPDGSIDAADFMLGPAFTAADAQRLRNQLIKSRDNRIGYVIWNKHITSSTVQPWVERGYTGTDPHTGHLHLSVNDADENDTREWKLEDRTHAFLPLDAYSLPVLVKGMDDDDYTGYRAVTRAQKLLGEKADGVYGDKTVAAVKLLGINDGKKIDLAVWVKLAGLSQR
jgi:hypothetical protein